MTNMFVDEKRSNPLSKTFFNLRFAFLSYQYACFSQPRLDSA